MAPTFAYFKAISVGLSRSFIKHLSFEHGFPFDLEGIYSQKWCEQKILKNKI